MTTTKTSEAIAKRMRKAGFNEQTIDWRPDGTFIVAIEGDTAHPTRVRWWAYEATAKTITAAYRDIERQWKAEGGK